MPTHAMNEWDRLAMHLSPIIGKACFCALYCHAVRLAALNETGPGADDGERSIATLPATLRDNLTALAAMPAQAANAMLLTTFAKLLAEVIGEALTSRLLNTAWAEAPDGKSI